MKIWIDFINAPQVSFFAPFIREFKANNHEVILTCRDSGNTVALLKQMGVLFNIVGIGVRKATIGKMFHYPLRIVRLYRAIRKLKPDIAIGQSSFYMPVVARILGIPSLYTNDNEHARGNIVGFLCSERVMLPKAMAGLSSTKKWPLKDKVDFYPCVKEAIYLSQSNDTELNRIKKPDTIYFRPEPSTAQYYHGPTHFLDDVLVKLSNSHPVIILPRDQEQLRHYLRLECDQIFVARDPIPFSRIVANCLLFIGAGGSMNRELAVLGIPVISIYQQDLLAVDQYLIEKGLIVARSSISAKDILQILKKKNTGLRNERMLAEGKQAYRMLYRSINELQNA